MGILSNLFKQKSAGTKFEPHKSRYQSSVPAPDAATGNSIDTGNDSSMDESHPATVPPSPSGDQPLKSISFGGSKKSAASSTVPQKKNITPTTAPGVTKSTRKAVAACANIIPDKQVIIDLRDLLPQIPAYLLKAGLSADSKKEFIFKAHELFPTLKSGRASASLSRLAELTPELFTNQHPGENVEIQLPLQKVVSQIGVFPCRPDQTEVQFSPLDPQYANLVIEKSTGADIRIDQPPAPIAQTPGDASTPVPENTDTAVVEAAAEIPSELPDPAVNQTVSEPTVDIEEKIEVPFEFPVIDEKVSYSLAALLPNMPKSWLVEDLKSIDDAARITVPFRLVEAQLATGKVELPFDDFFHAVPDDFKKYFSGEAEESKTARIQIPLNEVFQNLPGVEPLPPTPRPSVAKEQEEAMETKSVSETEEVKPVPDVSPEVDEVVQPESITAKNPDPLATEEQKVEKTISSSGNITEQPLPQESAEPIVANEPASEQVPQEQNAESLVHLPEGSQDKPFIEATQASDPKETAKQVEPAPPAETSNPVTLSTLEPVSIQLPTYRDPAADPGQIAATLTPPKVQLQRLVPPSVFAKDISAAPHEEPVQEPEPGKILAFEGVSLAFNPHAVETLFMTDGKLDPRKTVDHISHFPGVQGVALTLETETITAGDIPGNFDAANTAKAASILFQTLEIPSDQPSGAATTRNVALNHSGFSSTWFKQEHILLGILHPQRSLEEAMHDKLVLVTGELAQLR